MIYQIITITNKDIYNMNKQELNFLNQYVNMRMPRNASEWTDHYAFFSGSFWNRCGPNHGKS